MVYIYRKEKDGDIINNKQMINIFSHELGNVFGLYDSYSEANDSYEIYTNLYDKESEFPMKLGGVDITAGNIMLNAGSVSSNDIEMILQAFVENQMQFYTITPKSNLIPKDYSKNRSYLSYAIKNPLLFFKNGDLYYEYIRELDSYKLIGNSHAINMHLAKLYPDRYGR
jgi:hypothetical protein